MDTSLFVFDGASLLSGIAIHPVDGSAVKIMLIPACGTGYPGSNSTP
jgi:hypothetical protein